jgi:hypothetical protein
MNTGLIYYLTLSYLHLDTRSQLDLAYSQLSIICGNSSPTRFPVYHLATPT